MASRSKADVIVDTMKLSLNVIPAAMMELQFLKNIDDRKIYYEPDVIQCAIYRYEKCWLPLLHADSALGERKVPPLDVHWVWHVHMLSPTKYAEDCTRLHGAVFDHTLSILNQSHPLYGQDARMEWEQAYPEEPFELSRQEVEDRKDIWGEHSTELSYDILGAALRQKAFFYQERVLREFLNLSKKRVDLSDGQINRGYAQFDACLVRNHGTFDTPTVVHYRVTILLSHHEYSHTIRSRYLTTWMTSSSRRP